MTPQPIYDAYLFNCKRSSPNKPKVIYLSPQGKVLNQKVVKSCQRKNTLFFLCGHYEGIDERIIEEIVDEEISIGDYVLTGGEIPAMVLIDSVSRLVPDVLPSEDAYKNESTTMGFLNTPNIQGLMNLWAEGT